MALQMSLDFPNALNPLIISLGCGFSGFRKDVPDVSVLPGCGVAQQGNRCPTLDCHYIHGRYSP
jgi:hypothetical protein